MYVCVISTGQYCSFIYYSVTWIDLSWKQTKPAFNFLPSSNYKLFFLWQVTKALNMSNVHYKIVLLPDFSFEAFRIVYFTFGQNIAQNFSVSAFHCICEVLTDQPERGSPQWLCWLWYEQHLVPLLLLSPWKQWPEEPHLHMSPRGQSPRACCEGWKG